MNGDWFSTLIWLIFFMVMMYFYPRMMLTQILLRIDQTVRELAFLTANAKIKILRKIGKKDKKIKEKIDNFLEFFVVSPVNLDPFGIVKKIEHLMILELKRFKYFVNRIADNLKEEERLNLIDSITAAMTLHQLTKTLRHYSEFIKKTKNVQLGLLVQMQLPLIERISRAYYKASEAFLNGWAIGDGAGPLVVESFIKHKTKEIEEDTIYSEERIERKKVLILKPKGPGGTVGRLGRAVEKLRKKYKISKIITVDAAVKLEGEKTGSVAEGVGVAMGGIGVDRYQIEEIATKAKIPLDSYVVKMSDIEAILPMKKEIVGGVRKVIEMIKENLKESKTKEWILIIGVGNTCGIHNHSKFFEGDIKKIESIYSTLKKKDYYREEKPKKWYEFLFS